MTDARDALRAWLSLLTTANTIKKAIDAQMRQRFGVTLPRFDVLAALDRAGSEGATAGELTAWLKVSDGNTTQITAPMIAAGLVDRAASPKDGRIAIFRLTQDGQSLFDRMAATNRDLVTNAFAELSSDEITALRALLGNLRDPTPDAKEEAA